MSSDLYRIQVTEQTGARWKWRVEDIHGDLPLPTSVDFPLAVLLSDFSYQLPSEIEQYLRVQNRETPYDVVASEETYQAFVATQPHWGTYLELRQALYGQIVETTAEDYWRLQKDHAFFERYKKCKVGQSFQTRDGDQIRYFYHASDGGKLFYKFAQVYVLRYELEVKGWIEENYTAWGLFALELRPEVAFLLAHWKVGDSTEVGFGML